VVHKNKTLHNWWQLCQMWTDFHNFCRSDWASFWFFIEFISRSVREWLQGSSCSGYDICHPG